IRAKGPAQDTRIPSEEPRGPRSLAARERGPRPGARSGVGEGFPLGGGTSPRGGDGPEGDQEARARPRESRKEIAGDGRRAGGTSESQGGGPWAGTRRSPQASH